MAEASEAKDETDPRVDRGYGQRDGADRSRCLFLDHFRPSGWLLFPSGMAMWSGIFVALSLAYATALSYSELAKLYPAPAVPICSPNRHFCPNQPKHTGLLESRNS